MKPSTHCYFPTPFHSLLIDSMSFLCRSIKSHWEQWLHDSVKVRLGQRQWQHQVTYCFQSRGRSENNGYNASLQWIEVFSLICGSPGQKSNFIPLQILHGCITAVAQNFCQSWGLLHAAQIYKYQTHLHSVVYEPCPSSALQHFECGNPHTSFLNKCSEGSYTSTRTNHNDRDFPI